METSCSNEILLCYENDESGLCLLTSQLSLASIGSIKNFWIPSLLIIIFTAFFTLSFWLVIVLLPIPTSILRTLLDLFWKGAFPYGWAYKETTGSKVGWKLTLKKIDKFHIMSCSAVFLLNCKWMTWWWRVFLYLLWYLWMGKNPANLTFRAVSSPTICSFPRYLYIHCIHFVPGTKTTFGNNTELIEGENIVPVLRLIKS